MTGGEGLAMTGKKRLAMTKGSLRVTRKGGFMAKVVKGASGLSGAGS